MLNKSHKLSNGGILQQGEEGRLSWMLDDGGLEFTVRSGRSRLK